MKWPRWHAVVVGAALVGLGVVGARSCGSRPPPPAEAASALPPVAAPDDLIADLVVASPNTSWAKLQRGVGGAVGILPATLPGMIVSLTDLDPALDTPALLARLDEPRRIETEAVENRHVPGQVDTLRTYVYDGLALTVYDVAGGGALLQEVRVTDEGYTTAGGLGVGSRREAIEAAYPNSVGAEGGTVTYERAASPDDPTPETLRVRYDGDRAAELVWSFYVD